MGFAPRGMLAVRGASQAAVQPVPSLIRESAATTTLAWPKPLLAPVSDMTQWSERPATELQRASTIEYPNANPARRGQLLRLSPASSRSARRGLRPRACNARNAIGAAPADAAPEPWPPRPEAGCGVGVIVSVAKRRRPISSCTLLISRFRSSRDRCTGERAVWPRRSARCHWPALMRRWVIHRRRSRADRKHTQRKQRPVVRYRLN
jgi:hypothetical protein